MANGSRKRWRKKRRLDAARALAAGSGPAFGGAPGGGGPSQDEEEELEEGELRELPTPPDDVSADEEAPPAFDPAVEALVGPLTPLSLLKIIDDLPPPSFGFSERSRIRTRAILRGLAFLDIGVTIDAYVYIRPEVISSDDEGFELPNDGCRFVVTLYNGELLYFLVCTNISWMRTSSAESMGLHTELVEMMEWQMCHMPELIRKAAIHLGMPGIFHSLSVHISQHPGAVAEIELTQPRGTCRCSRHCTPKQQQAEWRCRRDRARHLSNMQAKELNHAMPTEYARQAAPSEQVLEAYARCRDVLEEAKLGNQDALCQSAGNKTSVDHGDGNNLGQFNALWFSAPELIWRLLSLDPAFDLGVWSMERGRVWIALRPLLEIIFNSAAGHCCLASKVLLKHVTDADRLRLKACAYAHERTQVAFAHVIADPSLQGVFQDQLLAAQFQSSLIGTTMYQQRDVMHQCLRAATIGRPEQLLRQVWQPVVEEQTQLTPAQSKEAKRKAEYAMITRLLELRVGMHVRVMWDFGEDRVGEVVEQPFIGIGQRVFDVGVRLCYADGQIMCERLGYMEWRLVRGVKL